MKNYRLFLPILFFILSIYTSTAQTDSLKVIEHFTKITKNKPYRNYKNIEALNTVAEYIYNEFSKHTQKTHYQEYTVDGKIYKNVICNFGNPKGKTFIIGAHYDVCGEQEGADDNASGVVALLELARQFKNITTEYNIELVAYTLEEPPYFKTQNMGSYIHAKSLKDNNREVLGMISIEMIGYFKDYKKSQDYPLGILSLFYGNKGDYITLVSKFGKGKFGRKFSKQFIAEKLIKTKKFSAPKALPGIDFSDHLNYWKFGYSALMITDTAFYRNINYHQKTDQMSTLDIKRMIDVINTIFYSVIHLKVE